MHKDCLNEVNFSFKGKGFPGSYMYMNEGYTLHDAVDITKGADTFGFKTKDYVDYEESICIFFFAAQCIQSKNAHLAVVYNTRTSQPGVVNLLEIISHEGIVHVEDFSLIQSTVKVFTNEQFLCSKKATTEENNKPTNDSLNSDSNEKSAGNLQLQNTPLKRKAKQKIHSSPDHHLMRTCRASGKRHATPKNAKRRLSKATMEKPSQAKSSHSTSFKKDAAFKSEYEHPAKRDANFETVVLKSLENLQSQVNELKKPRAEPELLPQNLPNALAPATSQAVPANFAPFFHLPAKLQHFQTFFK